MYIQYNVMRFNTLFIIFTLDIKQCPMYMSLTVFPVKPWTPEKISGMFFVSRPIRCEMKPQKITDKPQQGSVTTSYETTSWLFLLQQIFSFPFGSLWKSYILATNQHQSLDSVCSKTKLLSGSKSCECKLWIFTMVQGGVIWVKVCQLQKNTDRKPPITAN